MPSKILVYDHSKILEFGNVLQLIIVGYNSYVIKLTGLATSPMTINFDLVTFSVSLLSCNEDVIAAKSAFSFDCKLVGEFS